MTGCLYCSYPHLACDTEEAEQIQSTEFCPMCGWTRIVIETVPNEEVIKEAQRLYKQAWWCVVKDGMKLIPFDFDHEEEAQQVADHLGGELVSWCMAESEDPVLPNPYYLGCPLCHKRVPGTQHKELQELLESEELPERCPVCDLSLAEQTTFVEVVEEHESTEPD